MRERHAPLQPHLLSSVDTLALWRCDEAAGSGLTDATGAYTLSFGASSFPGSSASLITGAGGIGARDFTPTTYVYGNANAAAVSALKESYTVELWCVPTIGAEMVLVECGGNTETEVGNTVTSIRIDASGRLKVFWETGAGVDYSATASAMTPLASGVRAHLAVVAWKNGTTFSVHFYVNGSLVDQVGGAPIPTGGTSSPLWRVGASMSGSLGFTGTLDDIRVSKFAARAGTIRDSYARGVRCFDVSAMLSSGVYETHAWVYLEHPEGPSNIDRGIAYIDACELFGRSYVLGFDISEDVDDSAPQATIRLARSLGDVSLAPGFDSIRVGASSLCAPLRRVRIECAIVPVGTGRALAAVFRESIFEGCIATVEWPRDEIKITCADRSHSLQQTWTELNGTEEFVFGSSVGEPVATVMQNLVNTLAPSGGYKISDDDKADGSFSLYFPTDLTWNVLEFAASSDAPIQAKLEEIALQRGARARMRWDDHRKLWRYTVYAPDRSAVWSSGKPEIGPSSILETGAVSFDVRDVRNVIDVEGNDGTTDPEGNLIRNVYRQMDSTSIAAHGRLYARLSLPSASRLVSAAQCNDLASRILSDLKDPKATETRTLLFRGDVEVEDMVRVYADMQSSPINNDRAVVGVTHRMTPDSGWTTELTLRGAAPSGGFRRWYDGGIVQRGHSPGQPLKPPLPVSGAAADAIAEGIRVAWTPPGGRLNFRYADTEIHVSTSNGFTPSSSTLKAKGRGGSAIVQGLTQNTAHYVRLVHRDVQGNRTAASSQITVTPRWSVKTPGIHASRSSDYEPSGTGKVKLLWDSTSANHNGTWDAGVFTASTAGLYDMALHMRCTDSPALTVSIGLIVKRSGIAIAGSLVDEVANSLAFDGEYYRASRKSGTDVNFVVAEKVWLGVGDTVESMITKSVTSSNLRVKAGSVFSVRYVGGAE